MERVGVRELRNYASQVIRRAKAGERLIITVDGIPAAQIGPIEDRGRGQTIDDLIAAGRLLPRRTSAPPLHPHPVRSRGASTSTQVLDEHRDR
jgi:prevent-host-death family protein